MNSVQLDFTPATGTAGRNRFTVGAVRSRLSRLPVEDMERAAASLLQEIRSFNQLAAPGSRYLSVLEVFHSHLEGILPSLLHHLEQASPPHTPITQQRARLADGLLEALARAYANTLPPPHPLLDALRSKKDVHMPLVRGLELHARRLVLAHGLYLRAPPGCWASMHALYALARIWKLFDLDLNAPLSSPEAIYVSALLLAFADPARLSTAELHRTRDYIARFGDLSRIYGPRAKAGRGEGVFLIDLDADAPGVPVARSHDGPAPRNRLLLSTRSLLRRVSFHYDGLGTGSAPGQLGLPGEADPHQYRRLLHRLAGPWRGMVRQRAARQRFQPRAELHVGLGATWAQIQSPAHRPSGAVMATSVGNLWAILNESPGGYLLRYLSGASGPIRVGDLVLIRPRDQAGLFPCVVRRLHSEHGPDLHVGLQQSPGRFERATFQRADRTEIGHRPLLLVVTQSHGAMQETAILPAGSVRPGEEIRIRQGANERRCLVRDLAESTGLIDRVRLKPVR